MNAALLHERAENVSSQTGEAGHLDWRSWMSSRWNGLSFQSQTGEVGHLDRRACSIAREAGWRKGKPIAGLYP
jgi:hypothetical protein